MSKIEKDGQLDSWMVELNTIQTQRDAIKSEIDLIQQQLEGIQAARKAKDTTTTTPPSDSTGKEDDSKDSSTSTTTETIQTTAPTISSTTTTPMEKEETLELVSETKETPTIPTTTPTEKEETEAKVTDAALQHSNTSVSEEKLPESKASETAKPVGAISEGSKSDSFIQQSSSEEGLIATPETPSKPPQITSTQVSTASPQTQKALQFEIELKDVKQAEDSSPALTTPPPSKSTVSGHNRTGSGALDARSKKKSHSRSFSLGLTNVFKVSTTELETKPPATPEKEKEKEKEKKGGLQKWFGSKKDNKEKEKDSGKKDSKPSSRRGSILLDESEVIKTHIGNFPSSPATGSSGSIPVVSVFATPASPFVLEPEPIVRPSSPAIQGEEASASLRICVKQDGESDDNYTNIYLGQGLTMQKLKEKVGSKYSKDLELLEWVKMKNTRGRFVLLQEEDIPNLETDQELVVKFKE